MKEFARKHFFDPDGQVIPVPGRTLIHIDHIYNNPQLFGFKNREHVESIEQSGRSVWNPLMKRGFIRGEHDFDGRFHIHNLTHEGDRGATPARFIPALKTLYQHYSNHPKRKFTIGVFAGYNKDADYRLFNLVNKIVDRSRMSDEIDGMHTLNHIKEFIDSVKVKPKAEPAKRSKKSVESGPPIIDTSRLGKEPPMAQGNMTTAEWNYYRRMGLGDSYNPIKSFKEFLFENYE